MPTSYKPTISYRNGIRSLNYPAVGVSNGHHSLSSSVAGGNGSARLLRPHRSTLQLPENTSRRGTNNLPGSGKLAGKPGNSQHAGAMNLATHTKLDPQSAARLRHWKGNPSSPAQARWNCHHHNHNWWRHHCVTFVFFDFGWWGWYDGWWYPDPYYYNGADPIYGYGDLSPEQVVASVQVALQQQGYYSYAIDGQMGPQTRAAIGQYQADHRLPITYGVDPTTLGSLGIIR
ncbi:MAG TPA: peptidoglycan-binding protein [Chthoniobacterales bacterium]|nr:peptidoglycan-binding protein [Chthoniobacterales bacterium]